MAVDFDAVLEQVRQLSPDDQLRLIQALVSTVTIRTTQGNNLTLTAWSTPPGIVLSPHDPRRPMIEGTRIPVHHVAIWHDRLGMKPEEIVAEYGLTLSAVHAALAYYYQHPEEIDAAISAEEQFVATSQQRHPSKVGMQ